MDLLADLNFLRGQLHLLLDVRLEGDILHLHDGLDLLILLDLLELLLMHQVKTIRARQSSHLILRFLFLGDPFRVLQRILRLLFIDYLCECRGMQLEVRNYLVDLRLVRVLHVLNLLSLLASRLHVRFLHIQPLMDRLLLVFDDLVILVLHRSLGALARHFAHNAVDLRLLRLLEVLQVG